MCRAEPDVPKERGLWGTLWYLVTSCLIMCWKVSPPKRPQGSTTSHVLPSLSQALRDSMHTSDAKKKKHSGGGTPPPQEILGAHSLKQNPSLQGKTPQMVMVFCSSQGRTCTREMVKAIGRKMFAMTDQGGCGWPDPEVTHTAGCPKGPTRPLVKAC